jgi:ABC-type Mn2+/Zn2+ transport system permease subunit
LGLWLSYVGNLPTGPLIVCMYGLLLAGAGLVRKLGVGAEKIPASPGTSP